MAQLTNKGAQESVQVGGTFVTVPAGTSEVSDEQARVLARKHPERYVLAPSSTEERRSPHDADVTATISETGADIIWGQSKVLVNLQWHENGVNIIWGQSKV